MTLDTATTQELEMMNYIEQHIRDNYTIQLAITHYLIKLDYMLSPNNVFLYLNVYLGDTTTLIDKISFPITTQKDIWPTMTDVKQNQQRKLKHVVSIARNMLDLENTIVANHK